MNKGNAVIEILNESTCRLSGLRSLDMVQVKKSLTFHPPNYRFTPAYKSGRWDGKICLVKPDGVMPLQLFLNMVAEKIADMGYGFDIRDYRDSKWEEILSNMEPIDENLFSDCDVNGKPLKLFDYQVEAINSAIEEKRGIIEVGTGGGKTFIAAGIAKVFSRHGKVLVIVPSSDLVLQTRSEFRNAGLDCGVWYGDEKDDSDILVATWQSLNNDRSHFNDVVCCMIDECHAAKLSAKVMTSLILESACDVPCMIGLTGSVPIHKWSRIQIEGLIGKTIYSLSAKDLKKRGRLSGVVIDMIEIVDFPIGEVRYERYTDLLNFLFKPDNPRHSEIVNIINHAHEQHGNVFVMVPSVAYTSFLADLLEEHHPGKVDVINGSVKTKERKRLFKQFQDEGDRILVCTIQTTSTGIDIPNIMSMVVIEIGKAYERTIQMLGRGMRKHDGKKNVHLYDVYSNNGMTKRQAKSRISYYKRHDHEVHAGKQIKLAETGSKPVDSFVTKQFT